MGVFSVGKVRNDLCLRVKPYISRGFSVGREFLAGKDFRSEYISAKGVLSVGCPCSAYCNWEEDTKILIKNYQDRVEEEGFEERRKH
uniref:Uncharacterized protein n=1 Tax=Lactuca sativa TaxID=4236 RepID=A0A9R1V979_LACSA|nr:hypothetical protein LSAT_V11C600339210 [Lactuca sativa]